MPKDTMKAQLAASAGQYPVKHLKQFVLILIVSGIVDIGAYMLLYVQTGAWQLLINVGAFLVGIGSAAVAYTLIRRARFDAAGCWILTGLAIAYGSAELVFDGATLYLAVGGVLLISLAGGLLLPRKRTVWLIIVGLFGIFVWLVNLFEPLPRYDIAQVPTLEAFIPGITGLLALLAFWQIVRALAIGSIRTRLLVAFVALVLLTAAAISAGSAVASFRGGRDHIIAQLESVATLKEAEINAWLDSLRAELDAALFGADAVQRASVLLQQEPAASAEYQDAYGRLSNRFQQSIQVTKQFEELFLMDIQGQVVLSTDAMQEGKIYANETYFQYGLNDSYIRPPLYSSSLDRTSLIAARPVVDEQGQVLGVLAGRASMIRLNEVMNERAGLGQTGETYLVGANKALLTQLRFAQDVHYVRTGGTKAVLDNHVNGAGLYDGYQGEPVVGVYHWLPQLQVTLLAEQEQSEAFDAIYTMIVINLSVAILAVLVAAAIGFLVARNIANPLADLARAATQIATGDMSARAHATARGDEIGSLAISFNAMADRIGTLLADLETREQLLTERTLELEASQRVALAASRRTDPDTLLGLVVNLIRDQFHLYHVQVYLVEPPFTFSPSGGTEGGRAAVLRKSTGYAGRRLLQRKHQIPLERPALVTRAINQDQVVLVDDVTQEAGFMPNPLLPDTRSELVVPLKVGEQVVGALDAQDRTPGRFGESTVALFQTMTNQIAFLFENSDLLAKVTEQSETLTVFANQLRTAADIARQMGVILDPDHLLQRVVDMLQSHFGLYHAHIYVLDAPFTVEMAQAGVTNGRRLIVRAGSGEVGRVLRERGHDIPLNAAKSLVARAARSQQTLMVADTTLVSDFLPNPLLPQTRSSLSVPLMAGERVLGVLNMQDDRPNRFTESERDTFSTLAGQIATALQTADLFEQVQARFKVSQALAGAQTEEDVLDAMMTVSGFSPQVQVVLALYDQAAEDSTLIVRRVESFESGVAPVEIGVCLAASRSKIIDGFSFDEPLVVSNLSTDERIDPVSRQFLTGLGIVSMTSITIVAGDEQIGVLRASSAENGYFDERRLRLYHSLAEQGAVALRTSRLFDENQQTAERLRELDRLKSEFLASMSHELRTPLNSIIGYTEIMLMGIDGELDPETHQDVQAIYENGQHLLNLINDILDLSKIEAGSLLLNLEPMQIAPLLDAAGSNAIGLLGGKSINVVVEADDDLPTVQADRQRLAQTLNNMVSNAVKFTKKGAVTLRAYYERPDWLCIEIQDTGIGISQDDQEKIFDRFHRVDSSESRFTGGTGLGLAISRHLIELHGGSIEVQSQFGQGSIFTVRLPVQAQVTADEG